MHILFPTTVIADTFAFLTLADLYTTCGPTALFITVIHYIQRIYTQLKLNPNHE